MNEPKTIAVSEVLSAVADADDFIRAKHSSDAIVGYLWATLAGLAEKCGQPRPNAPWEDA